MAISQGELRIDKGLILRFLILFRFSKNLGFFVGVSRKSGPRADRSGHIEKARRHWSHRQVRPVVLHWRCRRRRLLRGLRFITCLILGCLPRGCKASWPMQTKNTNGKSGRLRSVSQRSLVFRSVQQAGNHARDPVLQAGPYAPSLSGNPQW
jgi:hypothetical protein